MTRPKPPRLTELGGMTEAGFNRVVAMIQPWDFWVPHRCDRPWGWNFPCGKCATCQTFVDRYNDWRASLPKTRNKKQRKKDRDLVVQQHIKAKFFAGRRVKCAAGCSTIIVLDYVSCPDTSRTCIKCSLTPIQRLQQFAADTGVPVSFEIAEAAMKGGG